MEFHWEDIYQDLLDIKNRKGSEQEYQERIHALFRYYLRWQNNIVAEECIHIGAANTIRPDFVLYHDKIPQVVIECKEPNHYQTERNREQLFSYMRQKKVDFGLYIGEMIQLYYDDPSDALPPLEIITLQFCKDEHYGASFADLFNSINFNRDRLKNFCIKRQQEQEKQKQINNEVKLLEDDNTKSLLKSLLRTHYTTKGYTEKEIDYIINNVVITIRHKANDLSNKETESNYNSEEPINRKERKQSRGRQYYSINGKGKYNKGRCALEVVKLYIQDHPLAKWSQLDTIFNTRVYNYISLKEEVEKKEKSSNDRSNTRRWFKDDPLQSSDQNIFYVTTQVGTGCQTNFEDIVKLAEEMGYDIKEL